MMRNQALPRTFGTLTTAAVFALPRTFGTLTTAAIFMLCCGSLYFSVVTPQFPGLSDSQPPVEHEAINAAGKQIEQTTSYGVSLREMINSIQPHNQSIACDKDVTPLLFNHWKQANETICTHEDTSITSYAHTDWEGHPAIHVYKHITVQTIGETIDWSKRSCQDLKDIEHRHHQEKQKTKLITTMNAPVIRVSPFDPFNSYERFHSYLNVAMAMSMFNVPPNPQLVYILPFNKKKNRLVFMEEDLPEGEIDMWKSFSSLKPIIIPSSLPQSNVSTVNTTLIKVPYMIDVASSGTSILVHKQLTTTKRGLSGGLQGRGRDHHCKSNIFQGIINWMRSNLIGSDADLSSENSTVIQVLWSSREPYCCRPKDHIYVPKRRVSRESELIVQLQTTLGYQYNITRVNFGNTSLFDSVRIASQSHVIICAHGAGLVWSSFLKPHSLLIEIFGGDRESSNRHYHNIASMADINYQSLHMKGNAKDLRWDQLIVDQITQRIQGTQLNQEPG